MTQQTQVSEFRELYRRAYGGDEKAEEQLFGLLVVMFRVFVRRRGVDKDDAEDVVQTALTSLLGSYRKGEMKANFAAWAQTTVKNALIDFHRARKSRGRRQKDMANTVSTSTAPPSDPILKARLKSCLQKLHASNPLHARIVNLHYLGYSSQEVCRKLDITANNRRVALCRARAMLRACLERGEKSNE